MKVYKRDEHGIIELKGNFDCRPIDILGQWQEYAETEHVIGWPSKAIDWYAIGGADCSTMRATGIGRDDKTEREPSLETVAEWRTRGGKYWYKLERDEHGIYSIRSDNSGGVLGSMLEADAIANVRQRVKATRQINGINMQRVY